MATTDEHARALGMVRLTSTDEDKGDVFVAWDEVGDVMAMRPRDAPPYATYRNKRGAYWNPVRESAAEVLRLLAEARERDRYPPMPEAQTEATARALGLTDEEA